LINVIFYDLIKFFVNVILFNLVNRELRTNRILILTYSCKY